MGAAVLFVVMTFALMIAIILIADSLVTAMIIVSLVTNFLVISGQFNKIYKHIGGAIADEKSDAAPILDDSPEDAPSSALLEDALPNPDIYGPYYEQWHSYQDGYTSVYSPPHLAIATSCAEASNSVDTANTFMAQHRARDRKCMDGWASKNADYYAYHYGAELSDTEAKPWWGRQEW
jgi:hypothetical protein